MSSSDLLPAGFRRKILCELGGLDCKAKRQLTPREMLEEAFLLGGSLEEASVGTGQSPFSFLYKTICEIHIEAFLSWIPRWRPHVALSSYKTTM